MNRRDERRRGGATAREERGAADERRERHLDGAFPIRLRPILDGMRAQIRKLQRLLANIFPFTQRLSQFQHHRVLSLGVQTPIFAHAFRALPQRGAHVGAQRPSR